jgi:hypothetical protein
VTAADDTAWVLRAPRVRQPVCGDTAKRGGYGGDLIHRGRHIICLLPADHPDAQHAGRVPSLPVGSWRWPKN